MLESNQNPQLAWKARHQPHQALSARNTNANIETGRMSCHSVSQHSRAADLSTTVEASSKRWHVSSSRGRLDASQYDKAKGSSCSYRTHTKADQV